VLYDHLPDKSKVHIGKRVVDIESSEKGATVYCQDETSFEGDLVAGADGIHSVVRSIMQKHMDSITPGVSTKDKNGLSAEYNCVFGIAEGVENLIPGELHRCWSKNTSNLTIVGKDGRVYFFLFDKLADRMYGDQIPKYRQDDVHEHIAKHLNMKIKDDMTFDDLWQKRTSYAYVPLEESQNENWTYDRFVCLGDSIHKVRVLTFSCSSQKVDMIIDDSQHGRWWKCCHGKRRCARQQP
jgi:2-polyprenyl-6-methoxyphenol hydroxylase-like FAD-dependent oxidoreductase